MAPIEVSADIARRRDEAFASVTDPSRFAEWQAGVVDGHTEDGATTSVGSKCLTTRRIGGAKREVTSQVTNLDPPGDWSVHGIDGPIRAIVNMTVEPLDATPQSSRVTIALRLRGTQHRQAAGTPRRP